MQRILASKDNKVGFKKWKDLLTLNEVTQNDLDEQGA